MGPYTSPLPVINSFVSFKDKLEANETAMANIIMQLPSWWWWEIGAMCISSLCCGLLIVFLAKIDGTSVSLWRLWIQPSTAIAIIAAFVRTSMMVPVVSCISQLKWRHFRTRHRPLSHLDLVDDASRGPWGALVLLFQLPRFNAVLSTLALVTVVSLGLEPSAQQLLETSTRVSKISDASGIEIATEYESKALRLGGMCNLTENMRPSQGRDLMT
jgi:hypothetical protein